MCVCTHMCLGMLVSTNLHEREEESVIKIKVTERKEHNVGGVTPAGGRAFRQPQRPSAGSPITAREPLRERKNGGENPSCEWQWKIAGAAGPFPVEVPGPTLTLYNDFTLSICSPKCSELEATGTKAGQELRPLLDHARHFKFHKAGFQGYHRILIRNLLTAKMTIKDTSYFKAASHHVMLVSL